MQSDSRIVPLSALRDNYIWAICADRRCVIVDPGEAAPVEAFLDREQCALAAILLTHHHADHQGGVDALLARHTVPVFGPGSPLMPAVTHPLDDNAHFSVDGFAEMFKALAVPGHTAEHIAFLYDKHLFCGDTLFAAGCGRLLGGTAAQLHASLNRLTTLPADTRICCAHEYTLSNLRFAQAVEPENPALAARVVHCEALRAANTPTLPSQLADELATNPFLRCDQTGVRAAASRAAGLALETSEATFTALRRWKDQF